MKIFEDVKDRNEAFNILGIILCWDVDFLKSCYRSFGEEGLNFLARCNIHFNRTMCRILDDDDLNLICSFGNRTHNEGFLKWLKNRTLLQKGRYYYFPKQNVYKGYDRCPSNADIHNMENKGKINYNKDVLEYSFTSECMHNLVCNNINNIAPYLKLNVRPIKGFSQEQALKIASLVSLYLRHCVNMIGYKSDIIVLSNLLMIKASRLEQLIFQCHIRKFDKNNIIFFDPKQRKHYNLNPNPTTEEIEESKKVYPYHVRFF